MNNRLLPRSARSARLLLRVGRDHGLTPLECLSGTDLILDQLDGPFAEVSVAQELTIAANLVRHLEPGIGLTAGAQYSIEMFGMFGFACMSAPTLRETIAIALRYQDLAFILAEAEFVAGPDYGSIVVSTSHLPPEVRRFAADHCIATVWSTLRDISDDITVGVIDLAFAAGCDADRYRSHFGVTPRFSQPTNSIGFGNAVLDRPREVDIDAMRECERQCNDLLARRESLVGTAGRVRERLARAADTVPAMRDVASDLFLSTRTLRRRLELEGTSFRELVDEVRQSRAEALIADGIAVSQIAHRLGYGSSSAFVHAYKRWRGITPGSETLLHR
ncbi:transcriptional regulator [Mycobacterium stomatepiae]|uniref:Transcriptional regulator n=1 Tax=Mycobacterium stomatepiae TaxID=470076 RepID=A0A7I7QIA3_9MYCO|nr:transcriptional regulator [Mycobacterium stomatepiae]